MKNYNFKNSIPFEVLNNYLDRAVTYCLCMCNLATYDEAFIDEAFRFFLNTGAKYIQRASGEWYASACFEKYYGRVKQKFEEIHKIDPDIIFEACIFETIGPEINEIPIPDWVFKAFWKVPEKRNFNVDLTVFEDGYGIGHWDSTHHIPDVTRLETQMFIYYRACNFINVGFEALHLGQVLLTGKNDVNNAVYAKLIGMIRDYAKKHSRRGYVLINAHNNCFVSPNGEMLVDMIVAPCRVHAAKGEVNHATSEDNPQRCDIEPGYWGDSIYNSNMPGISPSGWRADKYPYLVEFDNYGGILADPNDKDKFVWGKDEIIWYVTQPASYRREFMKFIVNKVHGYNENGHVALVGYRGADFFSNNRSDNCLNGSGDEETIKEIFSK